MNNGNGKVNPATITAQQATEAALRPLRDAEKRAATTRLRLAECEQVLAQAEQDYDAAQTRWVEEDTSANKQALRQTHDDAMAARSRVDGFKRKLATEEAAIAPLKAVHDEAMIALAAALSEEKLAHAEEAWSQARHTETQLEAQLATARQATATARMEYEQLSRQKRDNDQRLGMRDALARFRQNNPMPGKERVGAGF